MSRLIGDFNYCRLNLFFRRFFWLDFISSPLYIRTSVAIIAIGWLFYWLVYNKQLNLDFLKSLGICGIFALWGLSAALTENTVPSTSSFAKLICAPPFILILWLLWLLWLHYYNRININKNNGAKLIHLKLIYDNIKPISLRTLKGNKDSLSIFLSAYDEKYADKKYSEYILMGFIIILSKKIKRIRSTTHIRKNSLKISKNEINHQIDLFKKDTMNKNFYDFILNRCQAVEK